jgi:hypothetical protein
MQLPILFSAAVLRFVLGLLLGSVGGRFMSYVGMHTQRLELVHWLRLVRSGVYAVLLGMLVAAWIIDRVRKRVVVEDVCDELTNVRLQGMACAIGLTVLFTNGASLPLGLALATFKAVADQSAVSPLIACATVGVAMMPWLRLLHWAILSSMFMAYTTACHEMGADRVGGAVLATTFVVLRMVIRTGLLVAFGWGRLVKRGVRKVHGVVKPHAA